MDDSIIIIEVLVASVIIKVIDINVSRKRASSTLLHNQCGFQWTQFVMYDTNNYVIVTLSAY